MTVTRASLLAAVVLLACGVAAAADDPKDIAKARHDKFEDLGRAFKTIADEAKKDAPDFAAARVGADRAAQLAVDLPSWFPAGSGSGPGVKTDAKATIWTQPDDFQALVKDLQAGTEKLKGAAASGDRAGLRAQLGVAGNTCGTCHDKYRKGFWESLFGG